jgi:outer membrane murein-binding lipoprotein Lpp
MTSSCAVTTVSRNGPPPQSRQGVYEKKLWISTLIIGAVVLGVALLSSCAEMARLEKSAQHLQDSKLAYGQCLRSGESKDGCAQQKATFEADLAEYERHDGRRIYGR